MLSVCSGHFILFFVKFNLFAFFVCFDVGMCDLVDDLETIFHLC